jgi:hypothetical protein
VKDENGNLLADSHKMSNRRRNYFSQLLNVASVLTDREIHRAEQFQFDPSAFEVEIAIVKLKKYKWPDSDQILAEPIQAGGGTLLPEIHKLTNSIWNKEDLHDK